MNRKILSVMDTQQAQIGWIKVESTLITKVEKSLIFILNLKLESTLIHQHWFNLDMSILIQRWHVSLDKMFTYQQWYNTDISILYQQRWCSLFTSKLKSLAVNQCCIKFPLLRSNESDTASFLAQWLTKVTQMFNTLFPTTWIITNN